MERILDGMLPVCILLILICHPCFIQETSQSPFARVFQGIQLANEETAGQPCAVKLSLYPDRASYNAGSIELSNRRSGPKYLATYSANGFRIPGLYKNNIVMVCSDQEVAKPVDLPECVDVLRLTNQGKTNNEKSALAT